MKTIVFTATLVLVIAYLLRFRGSVFTGTEILDAVRSLLNAGRE